MVEHRRIESMPLLTKVADTGIVPQSNNLAKEAQKEILDNIDTKLKVLNACLAEPKVTKLTRVFCSLKEDKIAQDKASTLES